MLMFEENTEDFLFDWGVEAAYYDFVGLADHLCPLARTLSNIFGSLTRGEEGDQVAVEKFGVT